MRDQELVNALRYLCPGNFTCARCKYEPVCHGDGCAIIQTAADRIANQSTHIAALQQEIEKLRAQVPRWIPVEEQLPEDPVQKVLIFVPHTHGNIVDVGRYLGADGWVLEGWYLTQNAVTHWMPLPTGPEVENAETK